MNIGDVILLPYDKTSKDIDLYDIVGVVVRVDGDSYSIINAYGKEHSSSEKPTILAEYKTVLSQITSKGVELVGRVKDG